MQTIEYLNDEYNSHLRPDQAWNNYITYNQFQLLFQSSDYNNNSIKITIIVYFKRSVTTTITIIQKSKPILHMQQLNLILVLQPT